jgi:hypothetical protein
MPRADYRGAIEFPLREGATPMATDIVEGVIISIHVENRDVFSVYFHALAAARFHVADFANLGKGHVLVFSSTSRISH